MVDEKSPLILKDVLRFVLSYCIEEDELTCLKNTIKYLQSDELNYTKIERSLIKLFNRELNMNRLSLE